LGRGKSNSHVKHNDGGTGAPQLANHARVVTAWHRLPDQVLELRVEKGIVGNRHQHDALASFICDVLVARRVDAHAQAEGFCSR
jgi:hypothetical protein